jgi:hypothetical protein
LAMRAARWVGDIVHSAPARLNSTFSSGGAPLSYAGVGERITNFYASFAQTGFNATTGSR